MKCANKNGFSNFTAERSLTNFSKREYDVEKCLITLEEWIVALLDKVDSRCNVSKLRYCYWCVNTTRTGLNKCGLLEHTSVSNSVITMSEHLQNVLSVGGFMGHNIDSLSTVEWVQGRRILSPISRKCSSSKRKMRRKCRSHKRSKDNESVKKTFPLSKQYQLDLQYLIDQLYIQARTVLAENCLDDVHILKELGGYIDRTLSSKDTIDDRPLLSSDQLGDNCRKYSAQLWSGDCKINGDSHDSLSDTFDSLLESNYPDLDLTTLNDRLCQRYKQSHVRPFRSPLKRDSDFDEGFSENEFMEDIATGLLINKSSESLNHESLRYCGDCDYNSSNSKLYDGVDCHVMGPGDDGGSDSDGGTEILNSVNATVNKFNAIMEHSVSTDMTEGADTERWSVDRVQSGDHATPVQLESAQSSVTSDHRTDSPCASAMAQIHSPAYQQSQQYLSTVNCDPISKVLLSPISIQNWCSFNCNYLPTRPYNYYAKHAKNYDSTNAANDNYDVTKLSPWLPCSTYHHMANNHRQQHQPQGQQLHQIILSPQLQLPPLNLTSMQHSIVHLPQLFHQSPQHSAYDPDYLERRYSAMNNPKLFPSPNNNNSVNESLPPAPSLAATSLSSSSSSSSISIVTNTNNHSNTSLSKNHLCQSIFKASLDKSQRACCFYMRGGCKKEDCEYAHDLSKVTCKFWEKGDCFKSDTCPFKHGYHKD